jgi:hypothetical protein
MSEATNVPVTIEPEAAARVAELGLQAEFEQMLEQVRKTVRGLRQIEVTLRDRYDTGGEPGVGIRGISGLPWSFYERTHRELGNWLVHTYPGRVLEHLSMRVHFGASHAGQGLSGPGPGGGACKHGGALAGGRHPRLLCPDARMPGHSAPLGMHHPTTSERTYLHPPSLSPTRPIQT